MLDKSKLNKVGIDRIVINNFSILNFKNLEKKEIVTAFEYSEKFEFRSTYYSLCYSNNLKLSGEIFNVSSLEFNPSKYFNGHNIYNATITDVKKCLESIYENLLQNGIEIDFSEAKIKELEINITFEQDFQELAEVLALIGRANYQKALGIYSFLQEETPSKIKKDRSLYINAKMDLKKETTGKIIKFYDKTFEMFINHEIKLSEELTRIEVLFGRDYYRSILEKYELSNSLKDFLSFERLETIFKEALEKEIKIKPIRYLEDIKKNLTYDFNNFRRNEKIKRVEREKYKKRGKSIPNIYKEERGVFEYLKNNSWIFDYSFLLEIIKDNIASKQKKAYEKQVYKKYLNINNKKLYEKLLEKIFRENFLTH